MRLLLLLLLMWEGVGRLRGVGPLVPLPSAVFLDAASLVATGELFEHALRSTLRVAIGGGVGALLGVFVGVSLGVGGAGRLWTVPVALARPIPSLAWIPLTLLWFGVGEAQQIAVLTLAAFGVVVPSTRDAVAAVPPTWVQAAANLGARRVTQLKVVAHAALPGVLAAVAEGVAAAWFVLVGAEFVSATEGLGVLVLAGRDLILPARTFVGAAALAGCAGLSAWLLRLLRQRLTRWA